MTRIRIAIAGRGDRASALEPGGAGPIVGPTAYFVNSPPVQMRDDTAREVCAAVIRSGERSGLIGARVATNVTG